jgi:hypothetical protein
MRMNAMSRNDAPSGKKMRGRVVSGGSGLIFATHTHTHTHTHINTAH